jgi:hypothetical protein
VEGTGFYRARRTRGLHKRRGVRGVFLDQFIASFGVEKAPQGGVPQRQNGVLLFPQKRAKTISLRQNSPYEPSRPRIP